MYQCPVCGSVELETMFTLHDIPVFVNVLADEYEEAIRADTGDQKLTLCSHCGFVFNADFVPEKVQYSQGYHAERRSSSAYRAHVDAVISQIQDVIPLSHITTLEVGCGTGEFLKAVRDKHLENVKLIGVDPSVESHTEDKIHFDGTLFDKDYLKSLQIKPDVIINRHMIEHVTNPLVLLEIFSQALSNGGVLYLETPRLDWILEHKTFFDFTYEHCSYFTDDFMRRLLEVAGFEIISCRFTYQEQYFSICAKARGNLKTIEKVSSTEFNRIKEGFADMQKAYDYCKNSYIPSENDCIWGCSGKGVMWLNLMDTYKISKAIDIDAAKWNHFVLKTGHEIVKPEKLIIYQPKRILVMNAMYMDEIRKMVSNMLPYNKPEVIAIEKVIDKKIDH